MKVHIGAIIQRRLNEANLTRADLAKRIKKPYTTVTSWFDQQDISTAKLFEISEAIGYNLFYDILEDERLVKLVKESPELYPDIYVYNREEIQAIMDEKDRKISHLLAEKSEVQAKYIQLIENRDKVAPKNG